MDQKTEALEGTKQVVLGSPPTISDSDVLQLRQRGRTVLLRGGPALLLIPLQHVHEDHPGERVRLSQGRENRPDHPGETPRASDLDGPHQPGSCRFYSINACFTIPSPLVRRHSQELNLRQDESSMY